MTYVRICPKYLHMTFDQTLPWSQLQEKDIIYRGKDYYSHVII